MEDGVFRCSHQVLCHQNLFILYRSDWTFHRHILSFKFLLFLINILHLQLSSKLLSLQVSNFIITVDLFSTCSTSIQKLQYFALQQKAGIKESKLSSVRPLLNISQKLSPIINSVLMDQIRKEPPQSMLDLPIRKKGDHSNHFRSVEVTTNHYPVNLIPLDKIVIFRTKITPMIAYDNTKLRNQILRNVFRQISSYIYNPVISGMNIYSVRQPTVKEKQFQSDNYLVSLKQVKVLEVKSNPKVLLTFLNNGLRNMMDKLDYVEIGKTGKYFNSKNMTKIDKLMMYSGYKANFVFLEAGYFLRVDAAKKIVRDQTVLQFIDDFYKVHEGKDKDDKRNLLKAQLMNKIVMTNYGKTRYYKIIDIKFEKVEDIKIDQKNTSLKDYYRDKYNLEIKNLKQPLLQVEAKKQLKNNGPVLILPQLCLMTGIPENFDESRRKKISQATIKNPDEKINEIQGLMTLLKKTSKINELSELGINIKHDMAKIKSKQIPIPTLALGKQQRVDQGKQAFFNLFNKPIFSSKHEIKCAIITFDGIKIEQVIRTFESTSKNLGVKMEMKSFNIQKRNLKDMESSIKKAYNSDYNICLLILPNNMKNDYKKLKQYTITQIEMATQVMVEATLNKRGLQSIATKVLLQIIAKRGNTLWVPKTTFKISEIMLLAFDTSKSMNQTILSSCATINSTFSSIYSKCARFEGNQNKFKSMVYLSLKCIGAYVNRNETPPKEVIFFLNSCTGDQISIYHQLFINPLKQEISEIYKSNTVYLTVVMINVKTSERFFATGSQTKNVNAGTLISSDLVSPNYDFYLISQQSNRGTTVPNHYRVIYSNSKMQEGILQELVFSQCFNYVNWTGSIKVPAILQYAKKCAKFNAEVMDKENIPQTLETKIYFV